MRKTRDWLLLKMSKELEDHRTTIIHGFFFFNDTNEHQHASNTDPLVSSLYQVTCVLRGANRASNADLVLTLKTTSEKKS